MYYHSTPHYSMPHSFDPNSPSTFIPPGLFQGGIPVQQDEEITNMTDTDSPQDPWINQEQTPFQFPEVPPGNESPWKGGPWKSAVNDPVVDFHHKLEMQVLRLMLMEQQIEYEKVYRRCVHEERRANLLDGIKNDLLLLINSIAGYIPDDEKPNFMPYMNDVYESLILGLEKINNDE